jgi:hypothetical protein
VQPRRDTLQKIAAIDWYKIGYAGCGFVLRCCQGAEHRIIRCIAKNPEDSFTA